MSKYKCSICGKAALVNKEPGKGIVYDFCWEHYFEDQYCTYEKGPLSTWFKNGHITMPHELRLDMISGRIAGKQ